MSAQSDILANILADVPADMKWAERMVRPAISGFGGYSARGAATGALHLDANESPWLPAPADASVADFNRYPAQQPPELMARLADLYGVEPAYLMAGRGADEAIDVLLRTFVEPGERVVLTPPTFGYFHTASRIQGAEIVEVPLGDGFAFDADGVRAALREGAKLVFICSPNNPTGNLVEREVVLGLAREFPDTLVVVDEAYTEFADAPSLARDVAFTRNLVVTRTLSKLYGLAGVRMGVAIANPALIAQMRKVLPPYPVPRPVERAVLTALGPAAMSAYADRVALWKVERARVMAALEDSSFVARVYPSEANFVLFEARDIDAMLAALRQANVRIRDFRSKIAGHFRLSIGTPEENDMALRALGVEVETKPSRRAEIFRATSETDIRVEVDLEGGAVHTKTGNGFFDHMLEQIGRHGGFGLTVVADGDHHIDAHHTVEDTALAMGQALKAALDDKRGIGRYGFTLPMDETQARVAIDLSGRPAFRWRGAFPTDHVGEFAVEMCPHFFQSLSQSLGAAIHIDVEGENSHHMIEAAFKGVGRALRPALARGIDASVPSTKGVL